VHDEAGMNKKTIILIGAAILIRAGAGTGVDLFAPDFLPKCIGPADASDQKQVKDTLINKILSSGVPVSYVTVGQNFAGTPEIAKPEIFASFLRGVFSFFPPIGQG
jgi:hypothetical protein